MAKQYPSYEDYFKLPDSAVSHPTSSDRPALSFNQAAYLAEKAMEAVRASMESKGDTGGTVDHGHGSVAIDHQHGMYPRENVGMDRHGGHQQGGQRKWSGRDRQWEEPRDSYNSAPSEMHGGGHGFGDRMQQAQNHRGRGQAEMRGLRRGGRRANHYGYNEQEYQGYEYDYGYDSGAAQDEEHCRYDYDYQDGTGYSDSEGGLGEQYLSTSRYRGRGDGYPQRGWHRPPRGSQNWGFNDHAPRGRGHFGRGRGQQYSRGQGQQFSSSSRSDSGSSVSSAQVDDADFRPAHGEGREARPFNNRGTNRGPRRGASTRGSNFTQSGTGKQNQYAGSYRGRGGGTQVQNRSPDQQGEKRPDHSPGPVESSGSQSKGPIQLPSKGPNQSPGKGSNQPPSEGPDQSKTTSGVDHGKAKDNTSLNKNAGSEAKTGPVSEVKQKQMQGTEPVSGQSQKKMENMAVRHQDTSTLSEVLDKPGTEVFHQQGKGSLQESSSKHSDGMQPGKEKEVVAAGAGNTVADKQPSTSNPEPCDSSSAKESTDPKPCTNSASGGVEEDDNDSDEDTSFCRLCNMSFDSTDKYFRHTRGLLHTQRQMEADEKNPKSSTVPEPHVVPTRKPLWQRNSSQGALLPRIQAVLEPHFGTGKQGQQEGPQDEQGVKDQQQGLHGQEEEDVCGSENVKEHEHQQQWGKQERRGGGAGRNQQQHEWRGRQEHQELGDGDRTDEWSACHTDEWSAGLSGQQQWSAGQGGQEERKDQHQEEEKHWQPRSFGKVASAGRGGPREGAATATVQRRPAAATSQGLALISGDVDEDEDWEEEEWEEDSVKEDEAKAGDSEVFHCALCDINTTGAVSLRAHLNGRNHKIVQEAKDKGTTVPRRLASRLGPNAQVPQPQKPLVSGIKTKPSEEPSILVGLLRSIPEAIVGLRCVKEFQLSRQPTFLCQICDSQCDTASIQTHLIGSKHRMKYLKDYYPDIYEHVRTHGGKKSQLSAFLEEVCSDIEAKQGRLEPIVEQPEEGSNAEKKSEEKLPRVEEREKKEPADASSSSSNGRHLPHEVVMARYKEEKRRKEMMEKSSGPVEPDYRRGRDGPVEYGYERGRDGPVEYGYERGRDGPVEYGYERGWDGPMEYGYEHGRDRPLEHGYERGRDRPTEYGYGRGRPVEYGYGRDRPPDYGYEPSREHFERDRGRFMGPDCGPGEPGFAGARDFPPREPYYDDRGAPPFAPYREPRPYLNEEERHRHMYEYERRNFFYPQVGVSPEEGRHMMFAEYERLGVPYELACQRVRMQEERQLRMVDYLREGLSVEDARQRVIAIENRMQLIREYERQGLAPREARWRVVVEEERARLFEDYERRGRTPLEARTQIMSGQDRMHLIHEYERHGMPPEEARRRAIAEEDRLRGREEHSSSSADSVLDDIANKRLMENYLEQGMTREEAENKVIAHLRREGMPIQEAILRVQKIQPKVPSVQVKRSPSRDQDRESIGKRDDSLSRSQARSETAPTTSASDYDNITPEEAKERLLREYEKRGVPREEARKTLIEELIRSGVSPEEAQRRFSDSKSPAGGFQKGRDPKREREQRKRSYTGYNHTHPHTSSGSSDGSSSEDEKGHPKVHQDDRGRGERVRQPRRDSLSPRAERHHRSPHRDERDRPQRDVAQVRGDISHRQREEHQGRPTLTLGEELRLRKKRAYPDHQEEVPGKQARQAADAKKAASAWSADTAGVAGQPSSSKGDVTNLLESLTNNLISSEDDAAMALQVSKALTSALLKYRLKSVPSDKEEPTPAQSRSSFVERRIEDAKKLFETKLQTSQGQSFSSSKSSQSYSSSSSPRSTEAQMKGIRQPLSSQPLMPPPHSRPESSLGSIPIPPGRPPQKQSSPYLQDIFAEEDPPGKVKAGAGKKTAILPRVIYTKNHPPRSGT